MLCFFYNYNAYTIVPVGGGGQRPGVRVCVRQRDPDPQDLPQGPAPHSGLHNPLVLTLINGPQNKDDDSCLNLKI